jgi:pimeloyl-ACP methyl ester carboxylesterase
MLVVDTRRPGHSGHDIEVNGATLHYEEYGDGTPLVLVHGGLGSSAMWQSLVPELTARGDLWVITPDSRGHGRSTNPDRTLSYPRLADDLAALIEMLGLVRPVVGGWSDGGQVALELAARHPDAAGALIVGAAYPDFAGSGLRDAHAALLGAGTTGHADMEQLEANLGDALSILTSWHVGGRPQWRALVEQTAPMWLDYGGIAPDQVEAIELPTLVLTGDRDELVRLDLAVALYRALPNAALAVFPQAGHEAPMTPDCAPVIAALIRDFISRPRPGL